jgi:hypothetical protein
VRACLLPQQQHTSTSFAVCPAGQSSPLSPFFKEIITNLLNASSRTDPSHTDSTRLQISAFEAINDMVRAASPDTLDTVGQLTPVFLQEIAKTFNMPAGSGEQREKQAELQGQLCGVLQVRGPGSQQHCCSYQPVWQEARAARTYALLTRTSPSASWCMLGSAGKHTFFACATTSLVFASFALNLSIY